MIVRMDTVKKALRAFSSSGLENVPSLRFVFLLSSEDLGHGTLRLWSGQPVQARAKHGRCSWFRCPEDDEDPTSMCINMIVDSSCWFSESAAILAQAISCSNMRITLLHHELFLFCLVQVSATQICCFPPAFMMQSTQMCPIHQYKTFFQTLLSPDGSVPDLDSGCSPHKFNGDLGTSSQENFRSLRPNSGAGSIPILVQGFTRFENSILSFTQVVGGLAARVSRLGKILTLTSTAAGSHTQTRYATMPCTTQKNTGGNCPCRHASQGSLQNRYNICLTRIQHENQVPRICGNTQR